MPAQDINMRKKIYLSEQMNGRSENLELIKFFAAIFVIVHHAFDLNSDPNEWLRVITGGQFDLGAMSVSLFFFASGLFIAKSMEKLKTFSSFFRARFVRIWPPLFAVVTLCIFVGSIFSTLPPKMYFFNADTWMYYLNAVFVLRSGLPGVFGGNIYGESVNGALWTLPVEVLCYIACFIIYKLKLLEKRKIIFVMGLYLICALIAKHVFTSLGIALLVSALTPCYFFLLGHLLYVYRDKVLLDERLFIVCLCGLVICFLISLPYLAIGIFFPYILLYLAFMKKQCGSVLSFAGRYSYTIYLCGFPIQQGVIQLFGGRMNAYMNMLISIPLAIIVGALLHHCVERPVVAHMK